MGVDDPVPLFLGHVEDHAVAEDARVVHYDVDAAEVIEGGLHDVLAARHGGHRVVARRGLAALPLDLLDHVVGGPARVARPVGAAAVVVHHHLGPVLRQEQRDLAPDAARRAGDHRDLALEHHGTPLKLSR